MSRRYGSTLRNRHVRVERQPDLLAEAAADVIEQRPRIGQHFQVNDQRVRPGLDEPVEEPAGVLDHQVNFQRQSS